MQGRGQRQRGMRETGGACLTAHCGVWFTQGRGRRQRWMRKTGGACLTARCGAWFTWEATWDTRDGRCMLDRPLWGVVYARERSEATWDAQDGRCMLDRLLWGMVYVGGDVGHTRRAVRARPPIVGHGLHGRQRGMCEMGSACSTACCGVGLTRGGRRCNMGGSSETGRAVWG